MNKRSMMKRIRPMAIIAVVVILAVAAWQAYERQQERLHVLTGTIEATKADITPKQSGYIMSLDVKEGDKVQQGQIAAVLQRKDLQADLLRDQAAYARDKSKLAELQNGNRMQDIQAAAARTASAQASYDKAQRDYTRSDALYSSDAISKASYDESLAARDSAQANLTAAQQEESLLREGTRSEELDQAREELGRDQAVIAAAQSAIDDLTVYCPLNGYILTKNFEPGEYVSAGAAIATIADLSDVWVKVYVSSVELGRLKLGQKAVIRIDGVPNRDFSGHIKEISDQAEYTPRQSITKEERSNLVFAVKVAIDSDEGLMKPGMPADVIWND